MHARPLATLTHRIHARHGNANPLAIKRRSHGYTNGIFVPTPRLARHGARLAAALSGVRHRIALRQIPQGCGSLRALWPRTAPPPRRRCAAVFHHVDRWPRYCWSGACRRDPPAPGSLGARAAVGTSYFALVVMVATAHQGRIDRPAMGNAHARFRHVAGSFAARIVATAIDRQNRERACLKWTP